ncbi:unnamed protein product [Chrysoparadoxa australica]
MFIRAALALPLLACYAAAFVQSPSQLWLGVRKVSSSLQMASTADFKNGLTIEIDGQPVKITEFLHVKPGKGSAFVRSKLKNLITGNSVEKTFRAGESIQLAQVDRQKMQFTYNDGTNYMFMDSETFEEVAVPPESVGDKKGFLQEGLEVDCITWNNKVIELQLPRVMVLEVTETDPGVKGNTVQGGTKPATLETGAVINVPLFVNQGEKIKVDTEEKKYMSRE